MPGFDGTGQRGEGPMTGRGMGYCAQPLSSRTYYPAAYSLATYGPSPKFWGWGMGRGRWWKWVRGMWPGFGGWGWRRGW